MPTSKHCEVCLTELDERGICKRKGCPARRIKLRLWKLKQKKKERPDAE